MESKSFKQESQKINNLRKMLIAFSLSMFPFYLEAQNPSYQIKGEEKTPYLDLTHMEMVDPRLNLDSAKYKKVREWAIEQRNWYLEYMNSLKYLERLAGEYKYWEKMGFSKDPEDFERIENFYKTILDSKGDTVATFNLFKKDGGTSDPKLEDEMQLKNIFPPIPLSSLTPGDFEQISNIRKQRKERVKNNSWMVVDTIILPTHSSVVDGVYYPSDRNDTLRGTPLQGMILIRVGMGPDAMATMAHEEGHRAIDGTYLMVPVSKLLLEHRANKKNEYLAQATEIYARVTALRFLLKKYGIYDASTEDFEDKHFDEMLKSKELMENYQIPQLIETMTKEEIIWMMNHLAGGEEYDVIDGILFERDPEFSGKSNIQTG